jgi:hypothetical protein|tara:strand:- start:29426 stop:30064 length:639 start_codon:yes stop_codon:yes gene_type:complete
METKVLKELDLPEYTQPLDTTIKFLDSLSYSAVKTKYNAKGDWDAVSIKGYSDDINNILKPGVLKSDVEPADLRWTSLYEEPDLLSLKEILSHIPAEFERVRIMRLKAGTTIKKHTDKVDKEIKNGKLVRLHVPLRTSDNVHFYLWEGKTENHFNLKIGKYYYVDVSKPHAVHNKSDFDRLHLVVDCYNNPRLQNLLKQSEEFDDISSPIGF